MRCITNILVNTTTVIGNGQGIVVVTRDVVRMVDRARHLAARHAAALPARLWKPWKQLSKSWLKQSYPGVMSSSGFMGCVSQPACGVLCSSCGTA
jgi:hypothetical protein